MLWEVRAGGELWAVDVGRLWYPQQEQHLTPNPMEPRSDYRLLFRVSLLWISPSQLDCKRCNTRGDESVLLPVHPDLGSHGALSACCRFFMACQLTLPLGQWLEQLSSCLLTLDTALELFRVRDALPAFPDHSSVLLGFSPEVGASVHAGNVKNGDAFQEDVAQVHFNSITLRSREKAGITVGLCMVGLLKGCGRASATPPQSVRN